MKETDDHTPKLSKQNPEAGHIGGDRVVLHDSGDYVTDEVRVEVAELKRQGIDIEIVNYGLEGHYQLDDETQDRVNHAIEVYSQTPELIKPGIREVSPAASGWLEMAEATSPLALTFFYNTGSMERPSDGLSEQAILREPLNLQGEDEKKSASQIIRETNEPVEAEATLQRFQRFFEAGSMREGIDEFGLTAHDIMAGSLDRIGDVTRAKALKSLIMDHVHDTAAQYEGRGFVSASLACGAAEPVFWVIEALRAEGITIDEVNLVDQDPIALAASADRSSYYDLNDKVKLYRKNLLRGGIDSYIKPKSVDALDIVGLFEYFKAKGAQRLLEYAKPIMRPGGMIVFGNMLKSRPQQEWFDGLWPKLEQRTIGEVIQIIEAAGYPRDWLKIRIASDGLYAVYGLEIPDESPNVTRNLGQIAAAPV